MSPDVTRSWFASQNRITSGASLAPGARYQRTLRRLSGARRCRSGATVFRAGRESSQTSLYGSMTGCPPMTHRAVVSSASRVSSIVRWSTGTSDSAVTNGRCRRVCRTRATCTSRWRAAGTRRVVKRITGTTGSPPARRVRMRGPASSRMSGGLCPNVTISRNMRSTPIPCLSTSPSASAASARAGERLNLCVSRFSDVMPPAKPPGETTVRDESSSTHVTVVGALMFQSRWMTPLRTASRAARLGIERRLSGEVACKCDPVVCCVEQRLQPGDLLQETRCCRWLLARKDVSAFDVQPSPGEPWRRGWAEQQRSRFSEVTVHCQHADSSQQVVRGRPRDHGSVVRPVASAVIVACDDHSASCCLLGAKLAGACHGVPADPTLAVYPPLPAIDGHSGRAHPPTDPVGGVLDRFSGFRCVDHQQPDPAFDVFEHVRRDVDTSVDLLTEPLGVELGAEQVSSAVLDTDDQCSATGRVSHGRHLVGQVVCCLGVRAFARKQAPARASSSSFLLDVDALTFGL